MLFEQGLFESREKAKSAVMAGLVYIGTERVDKPGTKLAQNTVFVVKGLEHPYVGRGGLKLERAISVFSLNLQDKNCIDIGASTGGFTDCALQNGAYHVYAVDVGYGQLAWKLRNDSRVTVLERTNFRNIDIKLLDKGLPNFVCADVSFISLRLLWSKIYEISAAKVDIVVLIKPQFEAGKNKVGKNGIVREPDTHIEVIETIVESAIINKFSPVGLNYSPITGGDGNIEYLLYLKKIDNATEDENKLIDFNIILEVVNEAHQILS